jgi:hypothetical protein
MKARNGNGEQSGGKANVFAFSARQRWALIPTIGFLVTVCLILLLKPELLWNGRINQDTRLLAVLLTAAGAVWLSVTRVMRWLEPFSITLERDAILAKPMLGGAARVPYDAITAAVERPRTFFHTSELELQAAKGRKIVIRSDIQGYSRLTKMLRGRVSSEVRAQLNKTGT